MNAPSDSDRRSLDEALFAAGEFRLPVEIPEAMVALPLDESAPAASESPAAVVGVCNDECAPPVEDGDSVSFPVVDHTPDLDEPELPPEGYLHPETLPSAPPCLLEVNEPLSLEAGQTIAITPRHLRLVGPEPALIDVMVLSPCERGALLRDGFALTGGDVFTQEDVDEGRISYRHGGQSDRDGFTFATPDGEVQPTIFALAIRHSRRAPELLGPGCLGDLLDATAAADLLADQVRLHSGGAAGLAVVGAEGQGTWYASFDGRQTWRAMPETRPARALQLGPSDSIRFVPRPGWAGTVKLTYRAWDGSSGEPGQSADLSTRHSTGGSTAFSKSIATAQLVIPPTLPPLPASAPWESPLTVGDLFGGGLAVVRLDGAGTWQVSLDDGQSWRTPEKVYHGRALLLRETDRLRFFPKKGASGKIVVSGRRWDGRGEPGGCAALSARGSIGNGTAFGEFVLTRAWWLTGERA